MSKSLEALEMIVVDLVPKAKENNKEEIELIKRDLEVLEILKHCCQIRRNELLIYITDRTDNDIGNGVKEYEAFDKVKEWLER